MADVATAIKVLLANDGDVSGVVSARLYPDRVPQKLVRTTTTYPCIRYQLISDRSDFHLGGLSGLAEATVQVDAYALTRAAANDLGEKVRLAVSMYKGTSNSVVIRRIYPSANGFQAAEVGPDGTDLPRYRYTRDYHVFYQEATS